MKRNLIQVIFLTSVLSYPADNDSDEKRPYEFGFTIDGEQHRYEKKDEKGIIMGEFGFITADGIYHVTVYATDENGDFKIIRMKNIKVGFPPGKTTTTTAKPNTKTSLNLNGIKGCGGCLIPENSPTMDSKGQTPDNKAFVQMGFNDDRNTNINKANQPPSFASPKNSFMGSGNIKAMPPSYQEFGREKLNKEGPQYTVPSVSVPNKSPDQVHVKPLSDTINNPMNIPGSPYLTKPVIDGLAQNLGQNQINTAPVKTKLQPQLNEMEMKILDYMTKLYKFNYTLNFHGHEEMGDTAGNKNGSYFSNGRDGYQRKVVYIANQFGYQPMISLIKLDDENVPKEETEKELTKLKGSEFIWFYKKK